MGFVSARIHSEKFAKPQIRVFQLRPGVDQFGLLIGQRHFRPAHIQLPDQTRAEPLALRLELFLQDADRLFVHANLGSI